METKYKVAFGKHEDMLELRQAALKCRHITSCSVQVHVDEELGWTTSCLEVVSDNHTQDVMAVQNFVDGWEACKYAPEPEPTWEICFITYDWKSQPDPKFVNQAVKQGCKFFYEVEETQDDQGCWVCCSQELTKAQVYEKYEDWYNEMLISRHVD
jgi:hypothetical protein